MKKDIVIPQVKNVHVAAIKAWHEDFEDHLWTIYLVNNQNVVIDNVMVVSKASGTLNQETKKTSVLRHAYLEINAYSAIRIEILTPDLLELNNEFMVTYFQNQQLFDKNFIFPKKYFQAEELQKIPVIEALGIMAY